MTENLLIEKALAFATSKHEGQRRKYTNEPYIVHPIAVAGLVRAVNAKDELVAAALLHDVLEDTDATPEQVRALFGDEVADLVIDLTDVYIAPEHGNRKTRKAMEAARLAKVSADAQTIKVADMIDNTKSIVERAPGGFAQLYLQEKAALFDVLTKAHPVLRAMM